MSTPTVVDTFPEDVDLDTEQLRIAAAFASAAPWRRPYELRTIDDAQPQYPGRLIARAWTWQGAITEARERTAAVRGAGWSRFRVVVTLRDGVGCYDPNPAWD